MPEKPESPFELDPELQSSVILTKLAWLKNWGRKHSLWPVSFGLACCAIEMMGTGAAHNDLARFGMEVFRASPRQADLMIVAGRVSQKMAPVLRQVYDQMSEPKWVISMGACASTGGIFDTYAMVQGIDTVVPVDVYVPGCPPRSADRRVSELDRRFSLSGQPPVGESGQRSTDEDAEVRVYRCAPSRDVHDCLAPTVQALALTGMIERVRTLLIGDAGTPGLIVNVTPALIVRLLAT